MKPIFCRMIVCMFLSGTGRWCHANGVPPLPTPTGLTCEYREQPHGVECASPRLAWVLGDAQTVATLPRGVRQTEYQILVATSSALLEQDKGDLWDSGRIASDACAQIPYAGAPLQPGQEVWWKVRVWTNIQDRPTPWSSAARWSMGLMDTSVWKTTPWIGLDDVAPVCPPTPGGWPEKGVKSYPPATYLRKEFTLKAQPVRAMAYVTAQGVFELHLNGQRVGVDYFAPGWTEYARRHYYCAYDVTAMLKAGVNAVGALLGDGWYRGCISVLGQNFYGKRTRLCLRLHVTYENGQTETLTTDETWKATATGPVLEGDFFAGETYDARLEMPGWDQPGFQDQGWKPVHTGAEHQPRLEAYPGVPVRVFRSLPVRAITEPMAGVYVFDFGQNFAGWAQLRIQAPAGTSVVMKFGEMLNADGTVYRENLRSARAIDTYICKGTGEEVWEPALTFHGFRYVQVEGLPHKPKSNLLTGRAISSHMPVAGSVTCSQPMLNQLFSNIMWGQLSNYIEVPTDCPQRDERMGWTGDTQVFVRTGAYNADVGAFFTKWMFDVVDTQPAAGWFGNQAPMPHKGHSPAWGDAGVIVPWTLYQVYGDTRVLETHYESMKRFVTFYRKNGGATHIQPDQGFGDWLAVLSTTPKPLIGTAYAAYSTALMAKIAGVLNKQEDAALFSTWTDEIRAAFQKTFVDGDGRVGSGSQTGYLLALKFNLLTPTQREKATAHLVRAIVSNNFHLSTGFVGCNLLLPVLTDIGRTDIAYRLIQNTTYPSWGYSIEQGATTIWERWDSYTREKGFGDVNMNSFNHYAYGSCGEWMYRTLAGIDAAEPGFRRITIRPIPGEGVDHMDAHYASVRGMIRTAWRKTPTRLFLDVTVPLNTVAEIHVPVRDVGSVQEGGRQAILAKELTFLRKEAGAAVFEAGSGVYRFMAPR